MTEVGILESKKLALRLVAVAKSKKALRPVVLDMRKISGLCDYFIIVSANSHRQVNAIAQAMMLEVETEGIKPFSKALSNDESGWMALDFGSAVAHIFYKPLREFYSLESLWSDAKKVSLSRKA